MENFYSQVHAWMLVKQNAYLSQFLMGGDEMDCLLLRRFAFLGKRRMHPGSSVCFLHC